MKTPPVSFSREMICKKKPLPGWQRFLNFSCKRLKPSRSPSMQGNYNYAYNYDNGQRDDFFHDESPREACLAKKKGSCQEYFF
jgi:hypothetical protein